MSFTLKISDRLTVRNVQFFNEFAFDLKYDSIASGFSFSFYFDPFNEEHKLIASVTKYSECEVIFDGETLLTGNILDARFKHNSVANLCVVSGHSKTGILNLCQIPTKLYPLQSNGLTLRQITSKLIQPFNLKMVVDSSVAEKMDKVYKVSIAEPTQSVADYLVALSRQRDIVITHNEKGQLLFTSANLKGQPIIDYDYRNGMFAGTSFDLDFNGSEMHKEITVMKQPNNDGGNAAEKTIINPFVASDYFSSKVTTQTAGNDNDTLSATKRALAAELQNIKLAVNTDRWILDKKIIRPNNTISIIDPYLYLYEKTIFFIESISYQGNNSQTTAILNCVIPEVYSGETPKNIFE